MARKQITDLIAELRSWLPNYDHGAKDYPTVLYRILASAPGGDELEDMGYEPIGNLGWQELEQLGRVLETIQDKYDVEDLIRGLMSEEEEEVNEVREQGAHEMREADSELSHFQSWPEVLAYARTGAPLYYQAPMDHRATRLSPKKEQGEERVYEARDRTIRIWPSGSAGRGRNRTSDPFTADAGHLDRFRRPASAGVVSESSAGSTTESHELALYTVNDGDIYRQTIQPIIKNLAQKIHNGTYNADLAINAWLYAADAGAKKYTKEFGTRGPNGSFGVFTKADRIAAAREIGEQYDEEVQMLAKAKKSAPARKGR